MREHVLLEVVRVFGKVAAHVATVFFRRVEVMHDRFMSATAEEGADVFVGIFQLGFENPVTLSTGPPFPLNLIEAPLGRTSCVNDA